MTDIQSDIQTIGKIPIVKTLLEVIARTTGLGFTAIARVTDRQWVACAVLDEIGLGLAPGGELELETTICHEIRQSGQGVIIDNVLEDVCFVNHHTPKLYGFQSYISIPIILANGEFFGTLCALDRHPAKLNNPTIISMFKLYADLIAKYIQTITELDIERETAKLREQFIAMLGHDLRNPLAAIENSAQLLIQWSAEEDTRQLGELIKRSSERMGLLINNTLDLTRAKLGGGIPVDRNYDNNIEETLQQVITEQLAVSSGIDIVTDFDLAEPVCCDHARIAQLFSNLLSNAVKYGDNQQPITVSAVARDKVFTLSVANGGKKISEKWLKQIFEPFSRGEVQPGRQGLGLGLFIAAEITRAHAGNLTVHSDDAQTRFSLTMAC